MCLTVAVYLAVETLLCGGWGPLKFNICYRVLNLFDVEKLFEFLAGMVAGRVTLNRALFWFHCLL